MQSRAFNHLSIDHQKGIIKKKSRDHLKLHHEINYYLNLPNDIANFFPKLINYKNDYSEYSLEYMPYLDLGTLIINNKITIEEGKNILNKLFYMLDKFHQYKSSNKNNSLEIKNFYIKKTIERLNKLSANQDLMPLLNNSSININNKSYKNFTAFYYAFISAIQRFIKEQEIVTLIHGDFCFSNILYCPNTKKIKLIDPRGSFGNLGIYGHMYYDYAKLLHCLHGHYDYVVNYLYELTEINYHDFQIRLPYSLLLEKLHDHCCFLLKDRGINLEFLYLIEASLFLSMVPLHYESLQKQKVLFLTGIRILNNFFEGNYENLY